MLSGTLNQRLEKCLRRIDTGDCYNSFLSVAPDLTQKAGEIQRRIDDGTAGALAGALIGVKDTIAVEDLPLTCGSEILADYRSPYSATAVEKIEAADGLIVGKTNLDEFAMGSSGEYSAFGAVLNPHDPRRVSGGSSSGSAAAVAAGLVNIALGSDTGGSVRQPAAFCGIVGLKPTYGLISRSGLVSFAPSLDTIGILSGEVRDSAALLTIIAGHDPADATSMDRPVPDYQAALDGDITGLRIGLPREYFQDVEDQEIQRILRETVGFLKDSGAECIDISLPLTRYAAPCYYILAMAEASANLARFDGIRYGRRKGSHDMAAIYRQSRSGSFGPEVKRRIMLGSFILSRDCYHHYYDKAMRVRRRIALEYRACFKKIDLLFCPGTPETAFPLGERKHDPLIMYAADSFTLPASLAGLPALQIPIGKTADGLPVGGQIIADVFREETILRLGHYIERYFLTRESQASNVVFC